MNNILSPSDSNKYGIEPRYNEGSLQRTYYLPSLQKYYKTIEQESFLPCSSKKLALVESYLHTLTQI